MIRINEKEENGATAWKMKGPQADTCNMGSSAKAEWPTFLPSYSFKIF